MEKDGTDKRKKYSLPRRKWNDGRIDNVEKIRTGKGF